MAAGSSVFDVRAYGAKGDGKTLDTAAINQAVAACGAADGGKVLFPPGTYLSGTVHLRSRVTLFLDAGARLTGVADLTKYDHLPEHDRWHRALILGSGLEDVTIAGPGTIDGRKVHDPEGEEKMRGPHAVDLGDCRRVVIRDVTISDAANYAVLLMYCDQVEVRTVTFKGGWDGVHFRSRKGTFNRDLSILDCHFFTGDDSIAGFGMERVLVKDCTINTSCNGIRIIGPLKQAIIQGCLFYGPGVHPHRTQSRHNMLSGINLQPGAWGAFEGPLDDVLIADTTMKNVACPFNVWLTRPGNTADRILIQRLTATGVYRAAASVESWSRTAIGSVVLRDVSLDCEPGEMREKAPATAAAPHVDVRPLPVWGFYAHHVRDLVLDDVRLRATGSDPRPALACEGVKRLGLGRLELPHGAGRGAVVLKRIGRQEPVAEAYAPPRTRKAGRAKALTGK